MIYTTIQIVVNPQVVFALKLYMALTTAFDIIVGPKRPLDTYNTTLTAVKLCIFVALKVFTALTTTSYRYVKAAKLRHSFLF